MMMMIKLSARNKLLQQAVTSRSHNECHRILH